MEQIAGRRGVQNFPAQRVILNRAFHQRGQVGELGQFRERAEQFPVKRSVLTIDNPFLSPVKG